MHYKELQAGDICLSTTSALVSSVIRLATNSSVSHAFLVLGDGNILESIGEGVVIRSFWSVLTEYKMVLAFRHPDMTPEVAGKVIQRAKMLGRPKYVNRINSGMSVASKRPLNVQYDMRGAVGAAIPFVGNDPNALFCSEIVSLAYDASGLNLGKGKNMSPDDLKQLGIRGVLKPLGPVTL